MALITGTPGSTVTASEELYLEGAPQLYFADSNCPYLHNPDSDGFYWNLSGTSTYPVYSIGCYENVTLGDNADVNSVRCDVVGDKDVIQKRNHMEIKFTLKSFLPFNIFSKLINGGAVTTNLSQGSEKFGIGSVNNSQYWKFYFPLVYDLTTGDYVSFTAHRCKVISQGEITFTYGNAWTLPLTIWALNDESKPAAQTYLTAIRIDPSAI